MIKQRWQRFTVSNKAVIPEKIIDSEQEMEEIIERSRKYGVMSKKDKAVMVKLIKNNKGLPSQMRESFWLLSTAAARAKENNPDYY